MNKMKEHISKEEILNLPVTTNRLVVAWNKEAFFAKYAIVSYKMDTRDYERKNLSYEQLSETPSLSVVGIFAKYEQFGSRNTYTRFFVLVKKGDEKKVLESLRMQKDVACKMDDLQGYDEFLQQRIVVSLAINALGKKGKGGLMYNNGMLLVCDDQNFGVSKSRKELVCLKLEVNKYMNLAAKTTSFSHPRDFKQLKAHWNCVFKTGQEMDGELWLGEYLKPVVLRKLNEGDYNLDQLYIKKKRFSSTHNSVPYWPWNKDLYNHSRLFVICQVVENVNQLFEGMLSVDFTDHQVLDYFESHPKKDVEKLLKEYFQGKTILVEDPFGTDDSKKQISQLKARVKEAVGDVLKLVTRASKVDMVIRLCGPIGDESHYLQSMERMSGSSSIAVQHMIHHGGGKDDGVSKAMATRILMELLVKDSIVKGKMPSGLAVVANDWKFWRFKFHEKYVYGASLNLGKDCGIEFTPYGFDDGMGEDYDTFVASKMGMPVLLRMNGNHDYHVMEKDGNVYLIIDTEEIPILDARQIDDTYGKIIEGTDPECDSFYMFKRKGAGTNHQFLRGLMGFHLWKEEGLDGENSESYSYISGYNSDNFKTCVSFKIDKVPRVRRIFILRNEHPERVWDDIQEMKNMLAVGFGQWDELMTYPFPFKFLQEYLDNESEVAFSKHWSEL
nr:hypothetical protein [Prevotella sp.]